MSCCSSLPQPAASAEPHGAPEPTGDGSARGDSVRFEGGVSWIGTDQPALKADGEGPRRRITLKPFAIERFAVTNDRFSRFVDATGYVTEAERFGWSFVFQTFLDETLSAPAPLDTPWWRKIDGAHWRCPEGFSSTLEGRGDHPVVHVSWTDAAAFTRWCGGRLPSEAEWEHAARGGPRDRRFPWGDAEPTDAAPLCNIWQGRFPDLNAVVDGYAGTAPVDSFAPNPAGLHNMAGNVWEWCQDPFRTRSLSRAGKERDKVAAAESERTMKGGSYLCHASYCYRYRIAARMGRHPNTTTGHIGFRVAYD